MSPSTMVIDHANELEHRRLDLIGRMLIRGQGGRIRFHRLVRSAIATRLHRLTLRAVAVDLSDRCAQARCALLPACGRVIG